MAKKSPLGSKTQLSSSLSLSDYILEIPLAGSALHLYRRVHVSKDSNEPQTYEIKSPSFSC